MTMRVVAIYRSATYSPGRHRSNDAAIMDATTARLAERGWSIERLGEGDVEAGIIPDADLYLNMCQGRECVGAAPRPRGVGRADAQHAVECARLPPSPPGAGRSRHRGSASRPQSSFRRASRRCRPPTCPMAISGSSAATCMPSKSSDVVRTTRERSARSAQGVRRPRRPAGRGAGARPRPGAQVLRRRRWIASFTLFARTAVRSTATRSTSPRCGAWRSPPPARSACASSAATRWSPSRTAPVLVDLNDWPSFAPVRDHAATAIARLAGAAIMQRSTR